MITEWQLYWITRLDYLQGLCLIISLISAGVSMFFVCGWVFEPYDSLKRISLKFLPIALLFGLLTALIPDTKEMAAILIIPKIVNNESIQKLPSSIANLANDWIEELKPKMEVK